MGSCIKAYMKKWHDFKLTHPTVYVGLKVLKSNSCSGLFENFKTAVMTQTNIEQYVGLTNNYFLLFIHQIEVVTCWYNLLFITDILRLLNTT